MKVAIVKERRAFERRVAASPDTIKRMVGMGLDVVAESGAGEGAQLTDAAFAALRTKAPVIERFGLRGFGKHSNNAEYIEIDSIEPRLYLLTRMIMDVSQGRLE